MTTNNYKLEKHLSALSIAYTISISDNGKWILVQDFKLPPGFNNHYIEILVGVPTGYPVNPPGVASRVYVPANIKFKGKFLQDVYPGVNPGWGNWAWFCYQSISWDPTKDDLVKFMEMIRMDLTNPKTK